MRILLAVSEYHRGGGFPRHGTQLAVGLHRLGHEVTVLTQRADLRDADTGLDFDFYRLPRRPLTVAMAAEPLILTRRLRAAAARYDALICVGTPVLAPVVLIAPGTHRGYFVETLRTLSPRQLRWWVERLRPFHRVVMAWERAMHRGSHLRLVIATTEHHRRHFVDDFGVSAERVVVVPNAVELEEFRFDPERRAATRAALGVAEETKLLINVAGRGRQKGLDVIVRALEDLPEAMPWCMAFAGAGSQAPWLAKATASLRASGRVRLLGTVADANALYCAADLLVFPSRWDPWGLVVTEALACGLPVAVSRHAGSSVAVRPGVNGLVIDDPTDAAEVRDAIVAGLALRQDRDEVARTVEWLGVDSMVGLIEAELSRLVERG